ncbi:hypothetical protein TEA_001002 [Camellia sinensis var. sinensis]|uniref:Uncharacterized protein n=1 Tax=Camellia sinensis var. sinensis TaxID=542762 RepID=A0A4S4EW91_CAMSN|nr:hypothetical protein TEA_001002 [Camellia sinensis var. sinensis]
MWLGGGTGGGAKTAFVRYFCRKCAPNVRKINPKVTPQEAASIAQGLYQVIKQHGPLTVSNTWNHAKSQCNIVFILQSSFGDGWEGVVLVLEGFDLSGGWVIWKEMVEGASKMRWPMKEVTVIAGRSNGCDVEVRHGSNPSSYRVRSSSLQPIATTNRVLLLIITSKR